MKNEEFIEKLSQLSKDIILWNSDKKDLTDSQKRQAFYKIMKKYGIKAGKWSENGKSRICDNFEWTFCKMAFNQINHDSQNFSFIFGNDIPKELLTYGKKPKIK